MLTLKILKAKADNMYSGLISQGNTLLDILCFHNIYDINHGFQHFFKVS